jgi:hypothetical protein
MTDDYLSAGLRPLREGLVLALLAILFGFGLGVAFGVFEDSMKQGLQDRGARWQKSQLDRLAPEEREEPAKLTAATAKLEAEKKKVIEKAWAYVKRAHLHAGALGTTAVALILLLSFVQAGVLLRRLTAVALGAGALGYGIFWLLAAFRAPAMGSTGAAKESLAWLALPSSGLCVLGLLVVMVLVIRETFLRSRD